MHNGILPSGRGSLTRYSRVQELLPFYVRLTGPVTGFAGDPQISSMRGYPIGLRVMRGNPGGGMTANTGKVPDFGCCTCECGSRMNVDPAPTFFLQSTR